MTTGSWTAFDGSCQPVPRGAQTLPGQLRWRPRVCPGWLCLDARGDTPSTALRKAAAPASPWDGSVPPWRTFPGLCPPSSPLWGQPQCPGCNRLSLCMCPGGRRWPQGKAKPGTVAPSWSGSVLPGRGSAGRQLLLGRCLAMYGVRDQTRWLGLKSCCPPCRVTPGLAQGRVWVANGSGSAPRQGCGSAAVDRGRGGDRNPTPVTPGGREAELRSPPASTCPQTSHNKGPLSPPQYPSSGLSTCRLGWRRRRGGSQGRRRGALKGPSVRG